MEQVTENIFVCLCGKLVPFFLLTVSNSVTIIGICIHSSAPLSKANFSATHR